MDLEIKQQVQEQIVQHQEQIDQHIDQISLQAHFLTSATTLSIQLLDLIESEKVTGSDITRAFQEFERLYSIFVKPGLQTDRSIEGVISVETSILASEREKELIVPFNRLIRILASYKRASEIERLTEIAPNLVFSSDTAMKAMTLFYGRRVIGAAGAPDSWNEFRTFHEILQKSQ